MWILYVTFGDKQYFVDPVCWSINIEFPFKDKATAKSAMSFYKAHADVEAVQLCWHPELEAVPVISF